MNSESALRGVGVFLSGSIPDQPNEAARQAAEKRLMVFLSELSRGILASGGDVVFGGHPTITPVVHWLARQLGPVGGRVHLFQLERFRNTSPPEAHDSAIFPQARWIPQHGPEDHFVAGELKEMRQEMVTRADAGVFVGGRTAGNVGGKPGIRMEFEMFRAENTNSPVYLVGLLDGAVGEIIRELEASNKRGPNGLTDEQLEYVRKSPNGDTVATLILADLRRYFTANPVAPRQ
jgi:hypothetical protein